jgi:hypothetical protein
MNATKIPDDVPAPKQTLAEQISAVLNNPNLPEPLYNGIHAAINDVFNEHIDQSEVLAYEDSPERIAQILRGYQAKDD